MIIFSCYNLGVSGMAPVLSPISRKMPEAVRHDGCITISVRYTDRELRRMKGRLWRHFVRASFTGNAGKLLSFVLLCVLLAFMAAACVSALRYQLDPLPLFTLAGMLAVFIWSLNLFYFHPAMVHVSSFLRTDNSIFTLTGDGLAVVGEKGTAVIRREDAKEILANAPEFLYIEDAGRFIHVIPRRCFADQADLLAFQAFLSKVSE